MCTGEPGENGFWHMDVTRDIRGHRHRRGKLISVHLEDGARVEAYACEMEGCTHVLRDKGEVTVGGE